MGPNPIIGSRKFYLRLAVTMLLTAVCSVTGYEVRAESQDQGRRQPASSEPLVIQGRITGREGALVTVKTPDGYPGGPGGHAQFVTAGPTFRVDVSRARVLMPDGKQADQVPLAVGDRVVMVLSQPESGSPAPGGSQNVNQIYIAAVIERVVQSGTITTH